MVSTPAEVDHLLSAADEITARAGLGPDTRVAVERAVAAARELGDPGRLLHALGRATLNLAQERFADGGDVTELREQAEEIIALAGDMLADPDHHADAVFRTVQAGQILAATGLADRGRDVVERMWRLVAPRPADGLDARRARTAALTGLVTMRLQADPSTLGPLAAEMVDLQRGLARDTGEAAAVIDLADALEIFAQVANTLGRPDLMRVALTEQYSLAQMFRGSGAQERLKRIEASLAQLQQAPDYLVVPGSGAWRMRGSYLDLLAQPAPSDVTAGGFAARLAAESRMTDPAPGSRPPADPSVIADCAARLDHGISLSDEEQLAEADRVLAELADELSLYDGTTSDPTRRDVRRLWAAALYQRAMLRHRIGHSDDAWDLAWLSVVVAVRRHEGLPRGTATEQDALVDAITHMVDAATVAEAAGRPEDAVMLLSEAVDRCADTGAANPRLRRMLGVALHNLAAALLESRETATATPLAERACVIRRELAGSGDKRAVWEYANTLLITALLAVDRQDWRIAVERLAIVGPLLVALPKCPEEMLGLAGRLVREVTAQAPELVNRASADGSWPYQIWTPRA